MNGSENKPTSVYVADFSYHPIVLISCLLFLINYYYLGPKISCFLTEKYPLLPKAKRVDWNTRVNSTVHATLVSFICVYLFIYDDKVNEDPVWGESPMVRTTCAIVVGYMISDILIVLYHWKELGEFFFIFHHAACIYAYLFVITYGVLPWFANFRLIAEFSTPLVNQRWFLDAIEHDKSSKVFVVNGVSMSIVFFLVRIAVLPVYWGRVYSYYGTASALRVGKMWFVLVSSCAVLDSINIFWMYKIIKGLQKVLKAKREVKKTT